MMERFIIWKRFSLVRVLLLTGLLGCVHDKLDGPDQLGKVIDIELVIPGFEVPLTRSIGGITGRLRYGSWTFCSLTSLLHRQNYFDI
ncbi:MAG: hypothetical protein ACLU4N_15440 [Butyricimonas faecihominis]